MEDETMKQQEKSSRQVSKTGKADGIKNNKKTLERAQQEAAQERKKGGYQ
jgi:hypothetical protein